MFSREAAGDFFSPAKVHLVRANPPDKKISFALRAAMV